MRAAGSKHICDLIVLDDHLPVYSGFAALRDLRTLSAPQDVSVMMVSGLEHPRNVQAAVTGQSFTVLAKDDLTAQCL